MNANSSPKTPIRIWLRDAADELASAGITSALLDAEIILAHTLKKSRTWLHAHSDDELDARTIDIATARLDLRLDHTPIAYIIGHKEFYGRLFKVTPAVLAPRPESEAIIELVKKYITPDIDTLVDVGTGSGCLGITLKLELPRLNVELVDTSKHALNVAADNAAILNADVKITKSNLLENVSPVETIVANLPYVVKSWDVSEELRHEPTEALFADENGLKLIYKLIEQTESKLVQNGLLILEADPRQHDDIIDFAHKHCLKLVTIDGFALLFRKKLNA
jgi:release factor glutamine methyltransferase